MRLETKRYDDGSLRPTWFGAYEANTKRRVVTLSRWKGTPPASGKVGDRGDDAFEASRQSAFEQLRQIVEGEKSEGDREQLVQRVHRHRYGHKVEAVPLATLAQQWQPRRKSSKAFHGKNCRRVIQRFVDYMREHAPEIKELGAVHGDHVRKFFEHREGEGISAKTYNTELVLLRGQIRNLEPYAGAYRDFLKTAPARDEDTIHREPFTPAELKDVLTAAEDDPLIRSLIITAVCTAMRRGDVARLQWRNVDMKQGFVTVKTSKTGETVEIPILPLLREVLVNAKGDAMPAPADYVFPEAARLITASPDAIDRRLRQTLQRAGFVDSDTAERVQKAEQGRAALPILTPETTRRRGLAAIAKAAMTEQRRGRMKGILTRYMDGETVPQIAEGMQIARGLVSTRLADVERMIGAQVIRRPALPTVIRGSTIAEANADAPRIRRGSLKGWHSFRTTWITLALSAGVPMELVCRVTGHQTTDVVLKHYFRPGRDQFKTALQKAMPKLLMKGLTEKTWKAEALEIIRTVTPATLKRDMAQLEKIIVSVA
jgi:integrase